MSREIIFSRANEQDWQPSYPVDPDSADSADHTAYKFKYCTVLL